MTQFPIKHCILSLFAVLALAACTDDIHLKRAIDHSIDPHIDTVFMSVPLSMSVNEIHSLIIIKDGKVIAERYWPGSYASDTYALWSASKSFTSTAVGFAVQDGLLSLNDKVLDILDTERTKAGKKSGDATGKTEEWWEAMTVEDLLEMSSGITPDYLANVGAGAFEHPTDEILSCRIVFEPGSRFSYNSMNTYLLSAIVTKVTGRNLEDYLEDKFFKPLGIRRHMWETSTEGINFGGWGLHLTTESFAKLGMLYLQDGVWNGKRLLSHEWISAATSARQDTAPYHKDEEWKYGYGYQFWGDSIPGSFRADGAWSQFCFVFPDKDLVIACNAHSWNSGDLSDTIIRELYANL